MRDIVCSGKKKLQKVSPETQLMGKTLLEDILLYFENSYFIYVTGKIYSIKSKSEINLIRNCTMKFYLVNRFSDTIGCFQGILSPVHVKASQ